MNFIEEKLRQYIRVTIIFYILQLKLEINLLNSLKLEDYAIVYKFSFSINSTIIYQGIKKASF